MPSDADSLWLHRFGDPNPARPAVVCFPHAGGASPYYRWMAQALDSAAEVSAVQYPGRHVRHREPPATSVGELVSGMIGTVRTMVESGRGVVLFGHSMGATIAFELVRRLEEQTAARPAGLVVSGRRAPSRQRDDGLRFLGDDALLDELRRQDGTDQRVFEHPELVEMALRVLRADLTVAEEYRCPDDATVATRIVALSGVDDHRTEAGDVDAWRRHTSAAFEHREFAGGHFFLADHQAAVAELVLSCLRPTSAHDSLA